MRIYCNERKDYARENWSVQLHINKITVIKQDFHSCVYNINPYRILTYICMIFIDSSVKYLKDYILYVLLTLLKLSFMILLYNINI